MRTTIPSLVLALLLLGVSGTAWPQEPAKGDATKKDETDEGFVRRVYLDLTGKPPTAEQIKQFLDDKNPSKRNKLIDALLNGAFFDANLEQALKTNPDVLVAQAKVSSAQAELNRVRLQVTQKLETLQRQRQAQQALVGAAEVKLKRAREMHQKAVLSQAELEQAKSVLIDTQAKLAELDAELRFVIGKSMDIASSDSVEKGMHYLWRLQYGNAYHEAIWALTLDQPKAVHSMSERIRAALDKPIDIDFRELPVEEAFKALEEQHGIPFLLSVKLGGAKVNLKLDKVPLGAGLQALEDFLPGIRLVVRDYGILVTSTDRLPPGAVSVHDFWKVSSKPAASTSDDKKK